MFFWVFTIVVIFCCSWKIVQLPNFDWYAAVCTSLDSKTSDEGIGIWCGGSSVPSLGTNSYPLSHTFYAPALPNVAYHDLSPTVVVHLNHLLSSSSRPQTPSVDVLVSCSSRVDLFSLYCLPVTYFCLGEQQNTAVGDGVRYPFWSLIAVRYWKLDTF